jgi:hypothetical protein
MVDARESMNTTPSWTDVAGALGAITAAILGVGGVIWAVVRGFFLMEKRLAAIEVVFTEMRGEMKEILKNTEDTLATHTERINAMDWILKDVDRRLSTLEGKMTERGGSAAGSVSGRD